MSGFFVGDDLLRSEVARCSYKQINTLDAQTFAEEINKILSLYPNSVTNVQFNLLGSHDTPRFKTLARGDTSAYRLATLFQMTYPGAPSIYYGDEIGMEGCHDPVCRSGFPWDESKWDKELQEYVRRCITLRKVKPALRQGNFTWLFLKHNVVAYSRQLGSEMLLVILNNSHQSVNLDLSVANHLEDDALLRDVWDNSEVKVTDGSIEDVFVSARSGIVLEVVRVTDR